MDIAEMNAVRESVDKHKIYKRPNRGALKWPIYIYISLKEQIQGVVM